MNKQQILRDKLTRAVRSTGCFSAGQLVSLEAAFNVIIDALKEIESDQASAVEETKEPLFSANNRVKPGLYIIKWKSGGESHASIGMNDNGSNWIAPTNWVSPTKQGWEIADDVESIEFLFDMQARPV